MMEWTAPVIDFEDVPVDSHGRRTADTLILMCDNRPIGRSIGEHEYHPITACLNYLYALRHGYDFRYAYFPVAEQNRIKDQKQRPTCHNSKLDEPRAAPFCKLLGLWDAFNSRYQHVIFIDSDAIFRDAARPILDFLGSARSLTVDWTECIAAMLVNAPYQRDFPCTGIMAWKNGESARTLIKDWWNLPAGEYALEHPYEQNVFQQSPLYDRELIANLDCSSLKEEPGQMFRHVSTANSRNRTSYFRNVVMERKISQDRITSALEQISRRCLKQMNAIEVERALQES